MILSWLVVSYLLNENTANITFIISITLTCGTAFILTAILMDRTLISKNKESLGRKFMNKPPIAILVLMFQSMLAAYLLLKER